MAKIATIEIMEMINKPTKSITDKTKRRAITNGIVIARITDKGAIPKAIINRPIQQGITNRINWKGMITITT